MYTHRHHKRNILVEKNPQDKSVEELNSQAQDPLLSIAVFNLIIFYLQQLNRLIEGIDFFVFLSLRKKEYFFMMAAHTQVA